MSEKIDAINQKLDLALQELQGYKQQLAEIDAELENLAPERLQFSLLHQAVDAVQQLHNQGAADKFWGSTLSENEGEKHLAGITRHIEDFDSTIQQLGDRRREALRKIGGQQDQIDFLDEDLYDLEQEEESRRQEWIIEREESELPKIAQIMPWMRGFEEDERFRKILAVTICVGLLLGLILPLINIPIPERDQLIEVPERFVQLIQQQEKKPLPPPRPEAEQPKPEPEQKPDKQKVAEEKPPKVKQKVAKNPGPAVNKKKSARERVASKGILAFRESFSNLAEGRPSVKVGAKAKINNAGQSSTGRPERNMVSKMTPGSSGGINLSSLSRELGDGGNGDGGGGGGMGGVVTTQVASSLAGPGGSDRPLSSGGVAGRTDEEIQIVFDRSKAALYRLYNRELRKDPTLRGQIILQLTIDPDGTVSLCRLKGSDMDAPLLAQQVIDRVKTFNFGAKDVPAITIIYPIDFLPSA